MPFQFGLTLAGGVRMHGEWVAQAIDEVRAVAVEGIRLDVGGEIHCMSGVATPCLEAFDIR